VSLCCGIMGPSVHHLQKFTHVGLIGMADRWAWSPLAAKVASVQERPSLLLFGSINSWVPGIDSLTLAFHS
jgi:hypothetical protein